MQDSRQERGSALIVALLILGNAFFVAAEFALVSIRRTRVEELIAEGNRTARVIKQVVQDPDRFIAATQLGITMASLGVGWIAEPALAHLIVPLFRLLPEAWVGPTVHTVAAGAIAFTIITFLHVVVGELAPKSVALAYTDAPVKLVGTHVGVAIGEDGYTQMGLEDVACLRSLPNIPIVQPADEIETRQAVAHAIDRAGLDLGHAAGNSPFDRDVEVRIDAERILEVDRAAHDAIVDVLETNLPTFVDRDETEDHRIRERAGEIEIGASPVPMTDNSTN